MNVLNTCEDVYIHDEHSCFLLHVNIVTIDERYLIHVRHEQDVYIHDAHSCILSHVKTVTIDECS